MPDFALEAAHGAGAGAPVIGVDEAGRGPWAGPVVAAAVWLDPERLPGELLDGLDDSKKLAARRREELFAALGRLAEAPDGPVRLNFGAASVGEIDRLNILEASLLSMTRAVAALALRPAMALIDGDRLPALACPARAVIGGDGLSLSIAAASIAAKVVRDRLMRRLAEDAPGYGWERNAGYGTPGHRAALQRLGVSPHHRRSFRPVRELLATGGAR